MQREKEPTDTTRFWLVVFAAYGLHDGVMLLAAPGLNQADAYSFAYGVLPSAVWGWFCCSIAMLAGVALWSPRWQHLREVTAIAAMVGMGVYGALFGLSVEALTLRGTASASVGALKWWLLPLIAARVLLQRGMWVARAGGEE